MLGASSRAGRSDSSADSLAVGDRPAGEQAVDVLVGQVQAPEGIFRRRVILPAERDQGPDPGLDHPEPGEQVHG